jgi:hypothetical protein
MDALGNLHLSLYHCADRHIAHHLQLKLLSKIVKVWVAVSNVFNTARAKFPSGIRIGIPPLLCILMLQIEEQNNDSKSTNHHGA